MKETAEKAANVYRKVCESLFCGGFVFAGLSLSGNLTNGSHRGYWRRFKSS